MALFILNLADLVKLKSFDLLAHHRALVKQLELRLAEMNEIMGRTITNLEGDRADDDADDSRYSQLKLENDILRNQDDLVVRELIDRGISVPRHGI